MRNNDVVRIVSGVDDDGNVFEYYHNFIKEEVYFIKSGKFEVSYESHDAFYDLAYYLINIYEYKYFNIDYYQVIKEEMEMVVENKEAHLDCLHCSLLELLRTVPREEWSNYHK